MTSPDEQLSRLLQDYQQRREEAAEQFRRLNEISATASAPRQAVRVTVSARGEITAIDFPTGEFRRMAPKELSRVILATLSEARVEVLKELGTLNPAGLLGGVGVADLLQGKVDPSELLPEDPFGFPGASEALGRERGA